MTRDHSYQERNAGQRVPLKEHLLGITLQPFFCPSYGAKCWHAPWGKHSGLWSYKTPTTCLLFYLFYSQFEQLNLYSPA